MLLQNKKVLITAGPTQEPIDPVRYISNHSTGKMGYALAAGCLEEGADVVLVSGPVSLTLSHPRLKIIRITTALEMLEESKKYFSQTDIAVFTAAVADYRPEFVADQKIKKNDDNFAIHMVKNPDIAKEFGMQKKTGQLSIGFALETNDEESNALKKLESKNLDLVILNSMQDDRAAFGYNTNKISIFSRTKARQDYPLKEKHLVACDIVAQISALLPVPVL